MFWTRKPPPTKAELAKQAALSAASSLSERVSDLSGTLSIRAHDALDAVPTETIALKWDELRHATAERVAEAEKLLAEKWAATRPVIEEKAHGAAHSAAHAASDAAQSAQETLRQGKKQAESNLAEAQKELGNRKKELDKQLHAQAAEFKKQKEALGARRDAWKQSLAEEAQHFQAEAQKHLKRHTQEAEAAKQHAAEEAQQALETAQAAALAQANALPVLIEDGDTEIQVRESGGTSILVWVGVGILVGAILIYFFAPGSGRRSRAAIKDRLGKVKDDLVDDATKKNDANSERIEAMTGKAENKLAEVADVVATKVEDAAHALSARLEGAGESLAQGIETAGSGASDAASTVAAKVDDAKHSLADHLDAAAETSAEPVIAEPVLDVFPVPTHESVTDVVKDAQQAVEQIEAASRKKKSKSGE